MNLLILSKERAISYKPNENERTVIIRIHEPEEGVTPLVHESLFVDELYVFFHDIHGKITNLPEEVKIMSSTDAKRIFQFAKRHQDVDTMVVHCHAGVSRSASVALAITWYLELQKEEQEILSYPFFVLNYHMMTLFSELLGVKEEKSFIFEEMERRIEEGGKKEPFSW